LFDTVHTAISDEVMMTTLYVDTDNVLVDFHSGIDRLAPEIRERESARPEPAFDEVPGIFASTDPMRHAVECFTELSRLFDTYILSTAPWDKPSVWINKIEWVGRHFGSGTSSPAYKRIILSHHNNLNHGDFIVADHHRLAPGEAAVLELCATRT